MTSFARAFGAICALILCGQSLAADRVVTADGVATEIVYLLGAEDRLVGVDATSRFPEAARSLPQIGYFRALSAEGILSLAPDLLIASPSAGPPLVFRQLEAAGIAVVKMPEVEVLNDLAPKVTAVGAALGLSEKAAVVVRNLEADIAKIRATRPDAAAKPKVIFVLTVRDAAPLVAGRGTVPDEIIREAGAINVATFDGFKPISREVVIASAPDLLLMTDEHSATLGGPSTVLSRPDFALTPAGANKRFLTLPALTILGMGPRTPQSIRTLREALAK